MAADQDTTGIPLLRPGDPREVAGYPLLRRIGEGGMGAVYLSHSRGGQPVAIKVIREEFARDGEFRRRFEQEVRAARTVQGYHVVPVVDHDTAGTTPWLASRYVPGLALDQALARFGPLPLPAVLQLTGCVAEALRAVHVAGIVHRDLKPGNILLGADGPWVIDFGIARTDGHTQLTVSGGMIGTPQYMSPEHANGDPVTTAADVFALGLIAAVAATGRHPYGEGGAITLAARIANTELRPPDLSGYPAELRPLLDRCLAADPASRATPEELAALCERATQRPLRSFDGWLPAPLTQEIGHRETAVRQALADGPRALDRAPAPTRTHAPTVAASHPAYQPTRTAPPAPAPARATPAHVPRPYKPVVPSVPKPQRKPRAAVAVIAVTVCAVGVGGAAYALIRPDVGASAAVKPSTRATTLTSPSDAAPSPSASPDRPAAPVRYGPVDVTVESEAASRVDLDSISPVVGTAPADIRVRGWGSQDHSLNLWVDGDRTALVKLAATGTEPTAETCDAELRRGAGYFGVLLAVGDRYCYRTRAGRIAYLKLKTVQTGGPLRFAVTVWDATPR